MKRFSLNAAIVRVLMPNGTTAGTGFVVTDDGLVVTCAHVVEYAGAGPGSTVRLMFHETKIEREARVEPEYWRDPNAQDIAILRSKEPSLDPIHPVLLGGASGTDGHVVRTFGFPEVNPDGLPGKGEVIGRAPDNNVGVLVIRSPEITPGFSGAPVFDTRTGRVIGMVSAITPPDQYLRQGATAFATPTETLREVCPALRLSEVCPYLGLQAFAEDDAMFFYGRGIMVVKLLNKLRQEPSFLAVLGPSGSGKSSLVQAGLIPSLRQGKLQGSERWDVVVTRPTNDPFARLSQQGVAAPSRDLGTAVQKWFEQNPQQERLVLIIDQFEELFTSCPPSLSQTFLDQLAQILDSAEPITVILTMRDEFYSQFTQQAPRLVEWLERGTVNVPSTITQEDLIEIVQKPAEGVGLNFDDGLIATIVKDATDAAVSEEGGRVGRSTILPLLEFALTQLWEHRQDGFLTRDAFTQRVGGVTGGLTNWADRAFRAIDKSQRPLALRILTDLVHLGDEHQGVPDTRRRRQLTSLWRDENEREAVQQIVQRLVEARLLVTTRGDIEIIHDALLREWGLLTRRLQQDHRFLTWRQGIEDRVAGWEKTAADNVNSRDTGKLLRGGDLNEAEGWLVERFYDLNEAERSFIEESVALREREVAEQEAHRRELEQALTRANKELAVSESQRLAFASRSLSTSEPETALLLACEAVQWDHNPLSEDVLREALDNAPWQVRGFAGHSGAVNSAVFSGDGRHILTASDDGTARLWDVDGDCNVIYRGHKDRVLSAVFSPDENQILTASVDGTARLWRSDGDIITTLTYPRGSSLAPWDISASFSPDGQHVLVCDNNTASLWDAGGRLCTTNWDARPRLDTYINAWYQAPSRDDNPYERARSEGHIDSIYSAVFSPDGQRILTASADKTARIWDLSGQQLAILRGHEDQVINAIFSPQDGRLILTGSNDKTARMWSSDGELLATLEGHTADVRHLAFSQDGQLLLTAVDGGGVHDVVVRLWDLSGNLLATLEGHSDSGWIKQIAFSPDGGQILTASSDKTARLWDLEGRTRAVFRGHLGTIWDATFSPTSQSVLTASEDGAVRLWESTKSPLPTLEGHTEAVASAVYNVDGTHILTSSTARTTGLWNAAGQLRAGYDGNANLLTDNVLSSDGMYLLTVQQEAGQVNLWRLPTDLLWYNSGIESDDHGNPVNHITPSSSQADTSRPESHAPHVTFSVSDYATDTRITKAVFSSDAQRILTIAGTGSRTFMGDKLVTGTSSHLWDRQGKLVAVLKGPNLNPRAREGLTTVDFAMFSPDNQRVLGGSIDGTVWVWTIDGQLITSFLADSGSPDNLFSVTVSPDGQRILTTVRQKADLWDLNGRHLVSLPCQTNKVKRGLFSPKGDRILTVAEAAIPDVRLWDGEGKLIASLEAIGGEFAPVLFDREGERLCIVDGNIIRVWDRDGSLLATMVTDRRSWINHVAFSTDGEYLLAALSEGTSQLWMIREGGRLQSTFRGHTAEVNSAVFSPNGRRVLTASSDGTARQFLINVDDLLTAAARRVGRQLDAEEIARFTIQTPLRFDSKSLIGSPETL